MTYHRWSKTEVMQIQSQLLFADYYVGAGASPPPPPSAPMVADWYLHLNSAVIGAPVTAGVLNNGTDPLTSPWSVSGTFNSGARVNDLHRRIQIGSNIYDNPSSAHKFEIDNNIVGPTGALFSNTITERIVTVAGFVYLGALGGASPFFGDLVSVDGTGVSTIFQLIAAVGNNFWVTIENSTPGDPNLAPLVVVARNSWYWFSFNVDFNLGTSALSLYETSGFTLSARVTYTSPSGQNIRFIRIGNIDTRVTPGFNHFEHILIAKGAHALDPLGP